MLNRKEAVSFVENVQTEFEDDPGKYEKFLDIMWDLKGDVYVVFSHPPFSSCLTNFSTTSIGPSEVLVRIAALFNGYPDLAREFNAFLPPGYLLHPKGEGKSSHILLTTPEGTTVWPRDHVGVRQRR